MTRRIRAAAKAPVAMQLAQILHGAHEREAQARELMFRQLVEVARHANDTSKPAEWSGKLCGCTITLTPEP